MAPILEVRNLHVTYGTGLLRAARAVHALSGIDLTVESGETVGLVGESGCGKTTLARCILKLQEPTSGSVRFDGIDLSPLSYAALRARRREFQPVFQDPLDSLNPRMTVGEILAEPFEAHAIEPEHRNERIRELLKEVAIEEELLGRRPAELSGGQQQRIAIARALALKPRLLIADEPVSALDVSVQAQILELLARLTERYGLTLILISHSLQVIRRVCKRVVVMYLGSIVEEAATGDFFRAPRHPYSRALIACMPQLDFENPQRPKPVLTGDVPSPAARPSGCPFHPRCPEAFDRCRAEVPPQRAVAPGSRIACHI